MKSRLTRISLTALFILASAVVPTSAHTELVSTNPVANSTIQSAPESISLTFSEPPLMIGSRIELTQYKQKAIVVYPATLTGNTLNFPWPKTLKPGTIGVMWRAVADDGHVSSSLFKFNYVHATGEKASQSSSQSSNWQRIGAITFLILILVGIGIITRLNRRKSG